MGPAATKLGGFDTNFRDETLELVAGREGASVGAGFEEGVRA